GQDRAGRAADRARGAVREDRRQGVRPPAAGPDTGPDTGQAHRARSGRTDQARLTMTVPTIYALGTPQPSPSRPGALSVIRLSGPRAPDALVFLTERKAFE